MAARNNVAVFDLSYFAKMYLTGPDSKEAADWLFTANVDRVPDRVIYTCALNAKGGIEADVRVIKLQQGLGTLVGPVLKVMQSFTMISTKKYYVFRVLVFI